MVSRVHDSEVERVTGRSGRLAWWSADAERVTAKGRRSLRPRLSQSPSHASQVLVTCYGYH